MYDHGAGRARITIRREQLLQSGIYASPKQKQRRGAPRSPPTRIIIMNI